MKKLLISIGIIALVAVAVYAADEITISTKLVVANGQFENTRSIQQYKVTQFGKSADLHTQTIASNAWEQITVVADVQTNSYSHFRMLTTNRAYYIDLGVISGLTTQSVMRLYGSDVAVLPLHPTNAIWASAYCDPTTPALLEVWINGR